MDDIASFQPGTWNGKDFGSEFLNHIVTNFKKYSDGDKPYYTPYVSINHKDTDDAGNSLRFGRVDKARIDGNVLRLSGADIPEQVGAWANAGGLREPSIEYLEPVYDEDGNLIDGFRRADGTIEPTPVLKCLTLLGDNAPAVKGMEPLPVAKFSNSSKSVETFGSSAMDRTTVIATLKQLGLDVSGITDAVPDEVLKAMLAFAQSMNANPNPPGNDPTVNPVGQMADNATGVTSANDPKPDPRTPVQLADNGLAGGVGANVTIPGVGGQQPTAVTLKFADAASARAFGGVLEAQNKALQQFQQSLAQLNGQAAQQLSAAKTAKVRKFVDQLATPDAANRVRIQPVQIEGLVKDLLRYDDRAVRKFSDGKGTGTELDERMREIEATYLPIRRMGEQMKETAGATSSGSGGIAGGGSVLSPERRAALLKATPEGRAILAREKASRN